MNTWVARDILFPVKERLTGSHTRQFLTELERTQWLSPEELKELQWSKLEVLLRRSYDSVPYYREAFKQRGLKPTGFRTPEDFLAVPFLTKQDIRTRLSDMVSEEADRRKLRMVRTGGSTGEPLRFLIDSEAYSCLNAIELRTRGWRGIQYGDKLVRLWGSSGAFDPSFSGQWQNRLAGIWARLLNIRRLSAYDLSPQAMERYVDILMRFRPKYMYCYASSIYHLSRYILENAIDTSAMNISVIICTAEPLYEHHRTTIERAFHCKVANEYGSSESGICAFECAQGSMHIMAEHVYMEFLHDGKPVAPGEPGEIVITQLDNLCCPLIRYRLGDVGSHTDAGCDCGRGLPLLQDISGRVHDTIVAPDGKLLHGEFFTHIMDYMDGVARFKVLQTKDYHVEILLVTTDSFDKQTSVERLKRQISAQMGSEVNVGVELVDEIPLESSGKFNWIVSNVDHRWN